MRAGDSRPRALRRRPARLPGDPSARLPDLASHVPAAGPAGGRKGLARGASGRTRAGREAGALWRRHKKHSPSHTQAERAREDQVPGRGWGRRLVILVPGKPGKVSRILESLRLPHPKDSQTESLAQRRGQGVLESGGEEGRECREATQLAGPGAPRRGPVPAPSSPSAFRRGSDPLRAPPASGSPGFSQEPHPDLGGPGRFQPAAKPSPAAPCPLRRLLGSQRENETEVSFPTRPDNGGQRGRKSERRKM